MTNEGTRRHGALALFATTILVVIGTVVACATTEEGTDAPAVGAPADAVETAQPAQPAPAQPAAAPQGSTPTRVVVLPVPKDAPPAPATGPAPAPSGDSGVFAPYYNPETPRHLQAMEASLKPLVSIPARD